MLSWRSHARNGRNKLRLFARKNLRKPFLQQRTFIFNVCPATLWQWHRTGYLQHIKFGNKNMYPASAVKAITHARSMNETVVGYCKRKSKVDKNLPNAYDNDSKEPGPA